MARRLLLGALVGCALLATPVAARAQAEEGRFGERGQLVLNADRLVPLFGYTVQSLTANDGDATTKTIDSGASFAFFVGKEPSLGTMHTVPRVAVDFTVLPELTVGTAFVVAFGLDGTRVEERTPTNQAATKRETSSPGATILGFAPRVGYVVSLGKSFAFWPRAGLGFYSVKTERAATSNLGVTATATETDTLFSLDLDPQLVWTPIPHVLVFAGPRANVPLTGAHETSFAQGAEAKDRSDDLSIFHFGVSAGFGAWFDL